MTSVCLSCLELPYRRRTTAGEWVQNPNFDGRGPGYDEPARAIARLQLCPPQIPTWRGKGSRASAPPRHMYQADNAAVRAGG